MALVTYKLAITVGVAGLTLESGVKPQSFKKGPSSYTRVHLSEFVQSIHTHTHTHTHSHTSHMHTYTKIHTNKNIHVIYDHSSLSQGYHLQTDINKK